VTRIVFPSAALCAVFTTARLFALPLAWLERVTRNVAVSAAASATARSSDPRSIPTLCI
jgi:hypothetical protein